MSEIKNGIDEKAAWMAIARFAASLVSLILALMIVSWVIHAVDSLTFAAIVAGLAIGWAWPQPSEWPFNRIGRDR